MISPDLNLPRASGLLQAAIITLAAVTAVALPGSTVIAQVLPARLIYIHAGNLITTPGEPTRGPSTVIIQDDVILAIRDGFVEPEVNTRTIDLRESFVLPGLIDMHVHLFNDDDKVGARLEQTNRDIEDYLLISVDNARRTLEAGFTTVRDLGSDARSVTALRDAIDTGLIPGPTIVPAGRMISVTAGHGDPGNNTNRSFARAAREQAEHLCNGVEDCRRAVRAQLARGAEVIKFAATGGVNSNIAGGLEQQLFPDEMRAIVDTSHMLGLRVAAHAHGRRGIAAALDAGVDSIEHGTYTDAETNALFRERNAWLVPTLLAGPASLAIAEAGGTSEASLQKAREAVAVQRRNIAAAIEDGVRIAFGTDTGVSSHGRNAEEFALLVAAGLSPANALRSATIEAATLLNRIDTIGTLASGMQADIVAVSHNPLLDITELERVQFVMKKGVIVISGAQRQAYPPVE